MAETEAAPNGDGVGQPRLFGTFTGVFTPTLLTILGVIMYLRLGWVVGNAGLMGAWLIMGLGLGITIATGLSLSSIATNTRIGAGGPYAVIAKSLGLEIGGSIGVPLYLSRPLGIAMYVFGFREGIQWAAHEWLALDASGWGVALGIDVVVFLLIFGISYASADLAFRIQYLIMAIIGASLLSIVLAPATFEPVSAGITWQGEYPGFPEDGFQGTDFWAVFAVFFPATTGILAGANMSGELKDPRRAIPVGALSAIGLSTVIYMGLSWWATRAGTMEELASNYNLFMDRSLFPPAVFAGLLGATFSSALAGMVGGPRILMAMAEHRIMPASRWLGAKARNGEPRNALLLTGLLTFVCLLFRDLNVIAPLVTMFFLITYCVINVVVLVEDSLGLVSFRPTLKVPRWVPLLGAVGSLFAMSIVSPTFAIIAGAVVVAIYISIQQMGRVESEDDVRSSMFVAMAEWAASRVIRLEANSVRAWKPKLLIPTEDPAEIRGEYHFILDCCLPEGSIKLLGLASHDPADEVYRRIRQVGRSFQGAGAFATWSVLDTQDYRTGVSAGLQALQSAFFRPNLLFLRMPDPASGRDEESFEIVKLARATGVGVLLLGMHPKAGLGQRAVLDMWVRPQPPDWDAEGSFSIGNLNLTLLMGYRLQKRWGAELTLVTVVRGEAEVRSARRYLRQLCELSRLPPSTQRLVLVGDYEEQLRSRHHVDLHIMGLQPEPDFAFARRMVVVSRCTCLFVLDSGRESALA